MINFSKQQIIKLSIYITIVIPLLLFLLVSIGFMIFAHFPRDFSKVTNIAITKDSEYITLSAHGVRDNSSGWSDQLAAVMSSSPYPQLQGLVKTSISLDWRPFSDNVLICSVLGMSIGHEIGNILAKWPNLKGIHLIGHSCGAFIIFGVCEAVKSKRQQISIQTTYLDPVSIYSGVFWNFGINNFGRCADFSDSYIDVYDNVPGSNQALQHSQTMDVSKYRIMNKISILPHVWPTEYYLQAYKNRQVPIFYNAEDNTRNRPCN